MAFSPPSLTDFSNPCTALRWSMEKWLEAGQPHVQKRLKEYSLEFLKDLPAPEDHQELMRKGEEFIEEWEKKR
jgi:trimethylamine:corrinoid methyltransferase-like protein